MKSFKAFSFLGLLIALVLISSIVTADEKPKVENKDVEVEATKETNVPGGIGKKGYGGGGSGGGCGCCYKQGYKYCGNKCCYPQNEEVVSDEATKETNVAGDVGKEGYGGGGGSGGGGSGGGGGCGCCYKHGYHYCGNKCCYPQNEEHVSEEAATDVNPEGHGHGGKGSYGGKGGGGGHGGGKGGGGKGGGGGGRGGGT